MKSELKRYDASNFRELVAMTPYVSHDRNFFIMIDEVRDNGAVRYEAYVAQTGERADQHNVVQLADFFKFNLPLASLDEIEKVPEGSEFARDFSIRPKMPNS